MTALLEEPTVTSEESKNSLIEQIQQRRENDAVQEREAEEVSVRQQTGDGEQVGEGVQEEEETADSEQTEERKSFQFNLGEEAFDVAEDAEFEFKADGKNVKMTMREMRDAAAGGIAVRNRMRDLSEEKKKLLEPYEQFSETAEKNPLLALKKVFSVIKQIEPEADLNKFLVSLGEQAKSLTNMSASEQKAYHKETELEERTETLSEKERLANIQNMKQELMSEMGLSEETILHFGQQILADDELVQDIESDEKLFDRIGDLADEVQRQQVVVTALHKFDSSLPENDPLVFELSTLLEKNPDFDAADLEEIAEGVLKGVKKSKASKVLSKRQRSNAVRGTTASKRPNYSKMPPKESLLAQIAAKKKSQQS